MGSLCQEAETAFGLKESYTNTANMKLQEELMKQAAVWKAEADLKAARQEAAEIQAASLYARRMAYRTAYEAYEKNLRAKMFPDMLHDAALKFDPEAAARSDEYSNVDNKIRQKIFEFLPLRRPAPVLVYGA